LTADEQAIQAEALVKRLVSQLQELGADPDQIK
jgi:hypothetical protein